MSAVDATDDQDETTASDAVNTEQYLTFIMDNEEYGVDILAVQEIRGWESATPIPNSPDHIKGVINLRGTIVPIMDLRQRFFIPCIDYGAETVVIVLKIKIEKGNRVMGIIVDAISDVYDVEIDSVKHAGLGDNPNAHFIKGLVCVERGMVILLELQKLLKLEDG